MLIKTLAKSISVLIIEDNPGDTRLIKETLTGSLNENYNIDSCSHLSDGLNALSNKHYDILLLDLGLPDSSDLDTLRVIKEYHPRIPIVVLTLDSNNNLGSSAIESGAQDFITKSELDSSVLEKSIKFALERNKLETLIKTSENFYEKTFEQASLGMAHLSLEGNILKVNQKACELIGYKEQELLGQKVDLIIHDNDLNTDIDDWIKMIRGKIKSFSSDRRLIKKDGSVIWTRISGSLIKPAGKPVIIFITVEDIDLKKRSENILDRAFENYKVLAENSPDIIIRFDKELNILYANSVIKILNDKDPGYYVGKNLSEISDESDFRKWTDIIRGIFKTRMKKYVKESVETLSGSKTFEILMIPELAFDGEVVSVLIVLRDISERLRSEEELRKKNLLLEKIIENSPVGMWIADKNGNILRYNKTAELIWGITNYLPLEAQDVFRGWWTDTGKEIKKGEWALDRASKYGETCLNEIIDIESFDGQKKTIINSVVPILNSEEDIESILVINQDITRFQKMEKELKGSLAEKDMLMKEIHHRVKNNLQIILSLFNLQKNTSMNRTIEEVFTESQNRIRSMILVHDKLYRKGGISELDLSEYLTELIQELQKSFFDPDKNIEVELKLAKIQATIDDAIVLGLVVNELIVNAFKYAFRKRNCGVITVCLIAQDDKNVLTIKDNGDGIPENIELIKTKSLGLLLVNSLVSQLKGEIQLIRKEGSEFRITFS